jgi:hypothetical protein
MMNLLKNNVKEGLFKGLLMAYSILIFHIFLIAGLGFMVFFFSGLIQYIAWIFLGGLSAISASAYYLFRRMKKEGKNLKEFLKTPLLGGRSVEISLLGGFASFKLGQANLPVLRNNDHFPFIQLEDPATENIRKIKELVMLMEEGLITLDEYNRAKQKLFR